MKRLLLMSIILLLVILTSWGSGDEINELALTICIGIDKTEDGFLLTQQVLNPKAIAAKGLAEIAPISIYTEGGKDICSIMRKISIQSPRKAYNSHIRMVIFGEDFAKEGIQIVLDNLTRNPEYRTDFNFAIAKGKTANEILTVLTQLESVPGINLYKTLEMSEKQWGTTKSVKIIELINCIIAKGDNPVLTGLEFTGGELNTTSIKNLEESNVDNYLKFTSIGAFKNDKLVGWLNEDESKGYNYLTDNITITICCIDFDKDKEITFETIKNKTKTSASVTNGKPTINVEIEALLNITSVIGDFELTKPENKDFLINLWEKDTASLCYDTIRIAKEDLKTDIFGFGEVIHRTDPELWKKIEDDWNNQFTTVPVNVNVKAKINKLGQITESFFLKEKE